MHIKIKKQTNYTFCFVLSFFLPSVCSCDGWTNVTVVCSHGHLAKGPCKLGVWSLKPAVYFAIKELLNVMSSEVTGPLDRLATWQIPFRQWQFATPLKSTKTTDPRTLSTAWTHSVCACFWNDGGNQRNRRDLVRTYTGRTYKLYTVQSMTFLLFVQ